jgi:hypothetical protein
LFKLLATPEEKLAKLMAEITIALTEKNKVVEKGTKLKDNLLESSNKIQVVDALES